MHALRRSCVPRRITAFWAATGFMSEVLAPKWGALLVHAEERYYGTSLPFGQSQKDKWK